MKCRIPDADLGQKLHETICRYKGHPVWVKIREGQEIHLYKTNDVQQRWAIISKDDADFDISNVPLGYINGSQEKRVYYLTRVPVRRTKQGLSSQNLRIHNLPGFNDALRKPTYNQIMFSPGFADMVLGKYPPLETVMKELRTNLKNKGDFGQMAVSREIALSIDKVGLIFVYYKNEYIGWIQPDKFTVHVHSDGVAWVVSKYLSHILGWEID